MTSDGAVGPVPGGADGVDLVTELFARHSAAVHAYARRRLDRAEDAEDVVVEVFATAWRRRADLPAEPLPWLYATAAHVIAHVIRGDGRRSRLGAQLATVSALRPAEPDLAPAVIDAVSAEQAVTAALADLSAQDAELLRLWAWEQLEPAEVAAVVGCSPGTARTRLHRARGRLREALARRGIDTADLGSVPPQAAAPTPTTEQEEAL